MRKFARMAGAMAVLMYGCFLASAHGEDPPSSPKGKQGGFPDLVGALKATPGCIGVETARTSGGKQVIFAWFENKKAALAWYYSDTHQAVMKSFFPDYKPQGKPMAEVPDDSGPIMAIASITLKGPPTKENPLPFKQIAIELYQPLSGGLSIGGRFAPEKMKVPEKAKTEK